MHAHAARLRQACSVPIKVIRRTEGFLVFDFVKLSAGVSFNSNGLLLRGTCVRSSKDDFDDLYKKMHVEVDEIQYALCTYFTDLKTGFRILGPYWVFNAEQKGEVIYCCIIEAIRVLHEHGFDVSLVIGDAAQSNLKCIAIATGNLCADADFDVKLFKTWSPSPHIPGGRIYWCIDPVHAVRALC
jgi:hypothetical protein